MGRWRCTIKRFVVFPSSSSAFCVATSLTFVPQNQRKLDTLYDLTDIIWCKDLKQPPAKSPTQFCFELLGNGFGKQIFAVDSANDRTAWVTAITGIKGVQAKRGDISVCTHLRPSVLMCLIDVGQTNIRQAEG